MNECERAGPFPIYRVLINVDRNGLSKIWSCSLSRERAREYHGNIFTRLQADFSWYRLPVVVQMAHPVDPRRVGVIVNLPSL